MENLEFIDSHAHLAAPDFRDDLDLVVERARQVGVSEIICIGAGYGKQSAQDAINIAEKYRGIHLALGLHPCDSDQKLEQDWLQDLAQHPKVCALGETGLDYYWNKTDPEIQKYNFRMHIRVALENALPLVIHSRNAAVDCLQILQEEGASGVGGVFHCYSEDADFATKLRDINFLVSFPGPLTFKKADQLREVAREIPLEQILIETDCPFLAPQLYRGKRCEPAYVVEVAKTLADIKQKSLKEISEITITNTRKLFGI